MTHHTATARAAQWRQIAGALETAHTAWTAVSPDSAGPVGELLRDARCNATIAHQLAAGTPYRVACQRAAAEVGDPASIHIIYAPAHHDDGHHERHAL
jgi:hypothetical protein